MKTCKNCAMPNGTKQRPDACTLMEREDVEGGWGMKLQRWYLPGSDSEDAGLDDDGDWCRTEDVAELEAENETLHAEIKRLKAPPKILSAEEVTEPGWYWWTPGDVGTIEIVEVDYEYAPGCQKRHSLR